MIRLSCRNGRRYFLRWSFILSPGDSSEAPLDIPVVPGSFMRVPGAYSDAPLVVCVLESRIWSPGDSSDAPLLFCAKAGDAPITRAAATTTVFFISTSSGFEQIRSGRKEPRANGR